MSLTWNFAKVATPYGDVTTVHWAVPDDEDDEEDAKEHKLQHKEDKHKKSSEKKNEKDEQQAKSSSSNSASKQQKYMLEKAENSLETAEDELGSVLWNSNSVAAKFLHQYFSLVPSSSSSSSTSSSSSVSVESPNRIKILELGAGVGCLGIGLAFGGMDVCITDVPRLLPLMKVNVDMNRQKLAASGNGGKCFAAGLAWEAKTLDKDIETWWFGTRKNGDCEGEGDGDDDDDEHAVEPDSATKAKKKKKTTTTSQVRKAIVLCDALYGNPRGWPPLIRLLEKLIGGENHGHDYANVEIINFCEQRVKGVEDGFLKLLSEENERRQEKACSSLFWTWDLQELEEQSEMQMPIRRCIIKLQARNNEDGNNSNNNDENADSRESGTRRERGQ